MIIIGIGANLSGKIMTSPLHSCLWAVNILAGLPKVTVMSVSYWYDSPAWPPSKQPNYTNGIITLTSALSADDLLSVLLEVETKAGRIRSVRNAARPLDLDIIDYNGVVRMSSSLIFPHPRMAHRPFVLLPMIDVIPTWRHPVTNNSLSDMLASLPAYNIIRMATPEGTPLHL